MNPLNLDPGLAAVIDYVRNINTPIQQAITNGKPVGSFDFAALSGATSALLDAIDARVDPVIVPGLLDGFGIPAFPYPSAPKEASA